METILKQIDQEVNDIFRYNIETTKAFVVPSRNDDGVTFQKGNTKKGKTIETCVLMADIRDSTKLSKDLNSDKIRLGKIYSAFIHSFASIADEFGYVRNIIGDRIMVVFDPKDCYLNSLKCALLMNTVALRILPKYVKIDSFKIGIGIAFGEMLVLKTGIPKKHEEQSEYKNLVWIGQAANVASRLTDHANKIIKIQNYKIRYEPFNYGRLFRFPPIWGKAENKINSEPLYLPARDEVISEEEVLKKLTINQPKDGFGLSLGNVRLIEKLQPEQLVIPSILMTDSVYSGLKKNHPSHIYLNYDPNAKIHNRKYLEVKYNFKDVDMKVFGGNWYYSVADKI